MARDFEHRVRLAANISGDSDSTASMTGQLLGLIGGEAAIPDRWLEQLELRAVIEQIARNLETFGADEAGTRYPGW